MKNIIFADLKLEHNIIRNTHINIGVGKDISIAELADLVRDIVGFGGEIVWDDSKPDGTYQKLLDVDKIKSLGWAEKVSLEDGINEVYVKYVAESI